MSNSSLRRHLSIALSTVLSPDSSSMTSGDLYHFKRCSNGSSFGMRNMNSRKSKTYSRTAPARKKPTMIAKPMRNPGWTLRQTITARKKDTTNAGQTPFRFPRRSFIRRISSLIFCRSASSAVLAFSSREQRIPRETRSLSSTNLCRSLFTAGKRTPSSS